MTEDEKRILTFCIGKWTHIAKLVEQIPRTTLYAVATKLCGRHWLIHRRARGYMTTKRGTQALEESQGRVEALKQDTSSQKGVLKEKEEPRELKRPPVNLLAIRKFLKLSDKRVNCLPSFYPPLKKVPTPTHEAMIELLWAEICDRAWPVNDYHHLNFLNFGDTFRWKTHLALFCAYMVAKEGEDVSSYLIEASWERGYSLWIRGSSKGECIFKREILQKLYVCLEDYQNTDTDSKRAVGHLLLGRLKIDWQNILESISCVAMVNLNPREGKTLLQKTSFDNPVIRRLIPCDLNAIELPDLREVGKEAIEAAKKFGPLAIRRPRFDCKECGQELIEYVKKLFTEEGQELIDTDGLLNLARGFTGYGFTASEAIRYTLYKACLPYHTLAWLREEWIEDFQGEKPTSRRSRTSAPEKIEGEEKATKTPSVTQERIQIAQKTKEFEEKRKIMIEFKPKYKKLMGWIKWVINSFQDLQKDEIWNFLLPVEKEKCITTSNAFNLLGEHFGKIRDGDWAGLKDFESKILDFKKQYFLPAFLGASEGGVRYFIETMKILKDLAKEDSWDANTWSRLRQFDNSIMNLPLFSEEQKRRIREALPEGYKKKILMHKETTLTETSHKAALGNTQVSDVLERTYEKIKNWWKTRQ